MHTDQRRRISLFLFIFLALSLSALWYAKHLSTPASESEQSTARPRTVLTLSGEEFSVEVARTEDAQVRGLSGRRSFPEGTGMLFWFDRDDRYPFWMPDMHFSIDILWVDSSWRVVHIERDVAPESYPATFSSPTPARYVLEVPAGTAEKIGVKIGDSIGLSEEKS